MRIYLQVKKNMVFESITFLKFKTEIVRKFVKNKQEIISNPKVFVFCKDCLMKYFRNLERM